MVLTICIAFGDRLNWKEKVFTALALSAKATVQAALGPVAAEAVSHHGDEEAKRSADLVLLICILSIILTAPIGAVVISLMGPRLLTKTASPPSLPEWRRRSHRPSIRDISIIDEEEELESSASNPNKSDDMEIQDVHKKEPVPVIKEDAREEEESKS